MVKIGPSLRAHGRPLLVLGLPLVASNLAQFAIHITDTVMLGWYDVTALAALTIAGNFFFVVFIVGSGFAFALTPMVAAAIEQGDESQARRVTRMGFWLSALYAAVTLPPLMFAEPILLAIGQEPEVAAGAQAYLRIAAWALIPNLFVMVLKGFLSALERTGVILWSTVGAAILNAVVNYALIFGNWGAPEMGIRGAAVASIVTVLLGFVWLVVYTRVTLPGYALFQRLWKSDWEAFVRVFRVGLPIGVTALTEGGLFAASSVMMGWLGEVPLAAHGIALQVASVVFIVHVGLSQAATIRAGQALGRRDGEGLRAVGAASLVISALFAAAVVVVFLSVPELLISGFVDPDDPAREAIMMVGTGLLAMAGLFHFADALQVMTLGLLRGVQDTRVPMWMSAFSYWGVGVPVSYWFGFELGLGGVGVWLGLALGLLAAAILLSLRFWGRAVRIEAVGAAAAAG